MGKKMTRGAGAVLGTVFLALAPLRAGSSRMSALFLNENLNARQVAMGGLSSVAAEDSGALFSNPAGLALVSRPEANFSFASAQDNGSHGFAGYVQPLARGRSVQFGLGAGLSYFTAGSIDVNYLDGTSESLNAEKAYAGALSAGVRIRRWLAVGVSPKFFRSTLVERFSVSGFAADAGVMVHPLPGLLKERVLLGAALQNWGSKISYKSVQSDLPRTTALGAKVLLWDHPAYGEFAGAVQAEKLLDENWRSRYGAEYGIGGYSGERTLCLRGGYRVGLDDSDFSLGIGLREKNVQLDYAFVSSNDLDKTHRVTLLFRFGKYKPAKDRELEDLLRPEDRRMGEKPELLDREKFEEGGVLNKEKSGTEPYRLNKETSGSDDYKFIEKETGVEKEKLLTPEDIR